MGKAICTVEGFVAGTRAGTGKSGEYYFSISLACGKSTKDEATGQYENKYQQWWSLTAWGDYARELERMNIAKGTAVMARVENPRARVYHNEKSQRYEAVIEARLWNFSLGSMCWINKKSIAQQSSGGVYGGDMPEMDESYLSSLEGMGGASAADIPF
ncbi:single-stranded DNA-binding protein [Cloacibacillus sp. An23]|uniref:single-stranded DNA-binding protein n=1 Tax=Cloacibacillus sp. An23 TaxID=1965591 RepID=UPI000B37D09B|nr:single-stranded DNA-binding protein [Cloacibacillus sp. An23]OUO91841.1 hypothetical protein B5F39_11955 [Cloacibacillus sp. An23]